MTSNALITRSNDFSVAVIIPCYNSAQFLRPTIESALNQNHSPLQIIAVDDGSTDGTREILHSYGTHVTVLCHPRNQNCGAAASLNLAIRHTSADLISLLDSDDLFYPQKITKQVAAFATHPDVGLVYTNGYAIDENDRVLYRLFDKTFQEPQDPKRLLLNCYISAGCSTVMIRRRLFDTVGLFKPELRYSKDHDMWLRISEVSRLHYLPEILMAYRRHAHQQSQRRAQWEEGFQVLADATRRHAYGLGLRRKRLAVLYYRLARFDIRRGEFALGVKELILAGALDPLRALEHISLPPRSR